MGKNSASEINTCHSSYVPFGHLCTLVAGWVPGFSISHSAFSKCTFREATGDDGPRTHSPATHIGDLGGTPGTWFQPGQFLSVSFCLLYKMKIIPIPIEMAHRMH